VALDIVLAAVAAAGSIIGSVWTIRAVIKHEQQACDARLDAFKEGLDRGERDR